MKNLVSEIHINRLDIDISKLLQNSEYKDHSEAKLITYLINKYWFDEEICAIYISPHSRFFPSADMRKNILKKTFSKFQKIAFLNKKGLASWFKPTKENLMKVLISNEFYQGRLYLTTIKKDKHSQVNWFLADDKWKNSDYEFIFWNGYDFEFISWQNSKISFKTLKENIQVFLTQSKQNSI